MSRSTTVRNKRKVTAGASLLERWSRRKLASRNLSKPDAGEPGIGNATGDSPVQRSQHTATSIPELTDEDMPALQTLTDDSDYSDFLSPGVSEKLRKRALRILFRSDCFNIRDGLDEYDGDYTQFETLGNILTSDMRHQLALQAQRKAEQLMRNSDRASDADITDESAKANCTTPLEQVVTDNIGCSTCIDTDAVENTKESPSVEVDDVSSGIDDVDAVLSNDQASHSNSLHNHARAIGDATGINTAKPVIKTGKNNG